MYCNAACKKKHRKKHKKECERRVAELHDEKLFKQPPPLEDCPICFIRLPELESGRAYMACCGKTICTGCMNAPVFDDQGNKVDNRKCAFCRTLFPTSDDEVIKRLDGRMSLDDAKAFWYMGSYYERGLCGLPQSIAKALEHYHRAGELGSAAAYFNISTAYENGRGVKVDKKKAEHYLELAAMEGDAFSRHCLGSFEYKLGNMDRALRHYSIALYSGEIKSFTGIRLLYHNGYATDDDCIKAVQPYLDYIDEIKSDQRDKAAAFKDEYKYYEYDSLEAYVNRYS